MQEHTDGQLVIVVDDSSDMRELLRDVLVSDGYRVRTAATGGSALEMLTAGERPALVILDLLMPGLSGFHLRAEMLRRPQLATVPVVVLTAYWRRPGETLGVAAVLNKPVSIDRLLETVRMLVPPHVPAMADADASTLGSSATG